MRSVEHVDRHPCKHPFAASVRDDAYKEALGIARNKPKDRSKLHTGSNSALTAAAYANWLNPHSAKSVFMLELAAEIYTAWFQFFIADQNPVSLTLHGNTWECEPLVPSDCPPAANWIDAFDLATICRRRDLLDLLVQVPESKIRNSAGMCSDFFYTFIEALKAFHAGEIQEVGRLIRRALKESEDADAEEGYIDLISVPSLQLLFGCLDDQQQWDTAISTALQSHKKFYDVGVVRENRPKAVLCLPAIARSVYAFDRGLQPPFRDKLEFHVRSDYLPMYLVRGAGYYPRAIADRDVDRLAGLVEMADDDMFAYLANLYSEYKDRESRDLLASALADCDSPLLAPILEDQKKG